MNQSIPDITTLRRLRPLSQFSDEQLQSLSTQLTIHSVKRNEILIDIGCQQEFSLFILTGEVISKARDGAIRTISFDQQKELNPVAQLRPSMYEIKTASSVTYLKIDANLLNEISRQTEFADEDISVHTIDSEEEMNPFTVNLFQDLMLDNIHIPSLPDVARRIQAVIHDDCTDAEKLASIIQSDPVITAKLIKIANSALYQGVSATKTLQAAVVRLGVNTAYKQVMIYAAKELFSGQLPEMMKRMGQIWLHSRKVAAISRVLAKSSGLFDPEQAMLAGLVHDLGVIVIVEYLQRYQDQGDEKMIEDTIRSMRPQITGMLMRKWNFDEEMVAVTEECEDWFRNKTDNPDLCDLVLVAQYHSLMGDANKTVLPPIATIPAFEKLKMGPAESIQLIKESNSEIEATEKMLQL